jgi:hypothetical protein
MERPSNLIILEGISCLSFNKDRTLCVLSKKDKNLYIYKVDLLLDFNKWELIHTLKSVSINIYFIFSILNIYQK